MLELRELRRGDLAEVNRWRADRGRVGCLGASFRYIGPEVDESWFDAYLKEMCIRDRLRLKTVNAGFSVRRLRVKSR